MAESRLLILFVLCVVEQIGRDQNTFTKAPAHGTDGISVPPAPWLVPPAPWLVYLHTCGHIVVI